MKKKTLYKKKKFLGLLSLEFFITATHSKDKHFQKRKQ